MSTDKAAAYARFSTDRQDARSIDDQLRRCRAFAESRGLTIAVEYKDAAVSGAHTERADLQRLLEATRTRGGPPFAAVIVDDLSRLSRDLGNTWRIVFEDLAAANVRVIDASTGMASDGAGARLTFGAMALVNDAFLQLVKTETHRGLEGRALAGFATGGRVFGYSTEKEPNPPDPEHPRSVIRINPEEAEIVRRIFRLFAEGRGLGSIADALNREGVPAPYDRTKVPKARGRGWGQSTVRAMLLNERYSGRFIWNKRKHVRVPGRRHRRAVARPRSEWCTLDRKDLAIVDAETWARVAGRFSEQNRGRTGRPLGSGRLPHLLSGIARCSCGAGMGVVGVRRKNGVRYVTMGCAAHAARGDAICANALTVSEKKLNAAILGALRDVLLEPGLLRRFVDRFNERLAAARAKPGEELAQVDRGIQQREAAIRNLTDALVRMGWSEALQDRLREEEHYLEDLRRRRAELAPPSPDSKRPSGAQVEGYVRDLLGTLEADTERGRELLRRHLGSVTLTAKFEGTRRYYHAAGAFNLAVALEPENSSAPIAGGRLLGKRCCGGRI